MVLPLNNYDIDETGEYDTTIPHQTFEHKACPFCGERAIIIDGVLYCDDCGHRERVDR